SDLGVPLLRDVPIVQYLFSRKTRRDYQKSVLILVTPRRPSYANRPEHDIAAERNAMSEFERTHAEFEDRFQQLYVPAPNWAQVTRGLEKSPMYREFRAGDLKMESWVSRASRNGRLRAALGFLSYWASRMPARHARLSQRQRLLLLASLMLAAVTTWAAVTAPPVATYWLA